MAEPRKASLSGTVSWSSGELFTGFTLIGVALPTSGDYTYSRLALQNVYPPQRLPLWYRIPITNGQYDGTARIYWNIDLEPPNTRYVAWFYDVHNRQIGGPTAAFEVASESYTITVPTLTVPTTSTVPPIPDTNPEDSTSGTILYTTFVDNETPSGTIDGVNDTYQLDHTPAPQTSLMLYKNGQLLIPGTAFSLSGQTITILAGYIPSTGDELRASYRI